MVPAGHRGRAGGHDGAARALRDAGRRGGARRHRRSGLGALLFAGTLADHDSTWWPGIIGGRSARSSPSRATHSSLTRTRARLDAAAAAALFLYADAAALADQRAVGPHPARQRARDRLLHLAAAGRAPARGREARRPAHPAVSTKLLLAVVDGLKPAMLERAVATGRAPAMAAVMERGTYVDECAAAFPSVTPACAATIATGVRQDAHHIPSMNWYSRDEGRYVEYGSSFSASRRFGLVQQLTDTIYNMNATHLPQDVLTVFESLDDLGRAHGRHDLPDVPRALRAPDVEEHGAHAAGLDRLPPPGHGARRSSSTPTSSPAARRRAARSSACPASATSTPAASAPTWSSRTSSTSCCSRCPTTTRTPTATGRTRR